MKTALTVGLLTLGTAFDTPAGASIDNIPGLGEKILPRIYSIRTPHSTSTQYQKPPSPPFLDLIGGTQIDQMMIKRGNPFPILVDATCEKIRKLLREGEQKVINYGGKVKRSSTHKSAETGKPCGTIYTTPDGGQVEAWVCDSDLGKGYFNYDKGQKMVHVDYHYPPSSTNHVGSIGYTLTCEEKKTK